MIYSYCDLEIDVSSISYPYPSMYCGKSYDIVIKGLSDHQLHVFTYLLTPVPPVTVIRYWFSDSGGEGAFGSGQLEGEDESRDFLEVASQTEDLGDDVFETDDVAAEMLFHLCVGLDLNSFVSHLAV
jgi:hypothetical protein